MNKIGVCIGSSCHLKGSYNVLQTFQQLLEEHKLHDSLEIAAQFCMKECQNGVAVSFMDKTYSVSPENAGAFFRSTVLPAIKN
ncbi:MAG: (2Fe-2S) ferredoxin domain-containing protein [Christensenellales bacterium]|jgi:NADH:ubiquinone oxidoreductase subunit E